MLFKFVRSPKTSKVISMNPAYTAGLFPSTLVSAFIGITQALA
jgi:hypothetical protein